MSNPLAITLHASGAETTNGSGSAVDITLDDDGASTYPRSAAKLALAITAVSGTDPTLTVTIETSASGAGGWKRVGAFAEVTAQGHHRLAVAGVERYLRVSWTIGGSDTPSFTFAVTGQAVTCYAIPDDFEALAIPAAALDGVEDNTIARQLIAASDRVASYVNSSHDLPLTAWGDDIRMATATLAAWNCLHVVGYRPGEQDETFTQAYYELVGDPSAQRHGWLELVAAGKLTPIGITDATPDTYEGGGFVSSETARGWGEL